MTDQDTQAEGRALLLNVYNGLYWECYNPGWPEVQMRDHYERKHGAAPRYTVREYGFYWLGPIAGKRAEAVC